MSECLPDLPRHLRQQGADHPGGPWRPIPAPQSRLPWSVDPAAAPESREPAAAPVASAIGGVGEDKSGCARIELVTAIYCLTSHFEIACSDLSGDDLRKARNDIAHARCIAAKHNQNGPGCPQFPPACWGRPAAPAAPAAGQRQSLILVAQAVLDAVLLLYSSSAAREMARPLELPVIAATIRALADQAGSSKHWHADELRAIAAELEGADA